MHAHGAKLLNQNGEWQDAESHPTHTDRNVRKLSVLSKARLDRAANQLIQSLGMDLVVGCDLKQRQALLWQVLAKLALDTKLPESSNSQDAVSTAKVEARLA